MERIFLSYHFDEQGRELADLVERLIHSHGIQPVNGRRLAGEPLRDEVQKRIAKCDGLVCLLTEREAGRTNQWVRDERAYAEGQGKRVIALVDDRLDVGGMFADKERLEFAHNDLATVLLKLSETLGQWRQEGGRVVPLRLEPDKAAQLAIDGGEFVRIRYRFWKRDEASDWHEATAVPREGGVLIYLKGVSEDVSVEISLEGQNTTWRSNVESQILRAPMRQV